MIVTTAAADVAGVTVPEDGDTESHWEPPEVVDADTEKFSDPDPPLSNVTDCADGWPPPATVS